MKREIKFRGKAKENNIWLYGNIQIPSKENVGYFMWGGKYNLQYEVFPETIGQFTGLLDKNGKEIYEGDIIKVVYVHDGDIKCWKQPCGPAIPQEVKWDDELLRWSFGGCGRILYAPKDFEVIGNIHDNPELIKD